NDAKYVKNAKLNGRLVSDNLLRHSALKKGGTLTFEMSANR
ncbi:MAG: glycoside hydrolase family 92 protein, partial [Acidobacteria bacterium]|nr:glycoside hydrolase family 92 protein [Acidobacteriota bacterium]